MTSKRGRKSKLTDQTIAIVADLIIGGATDKAACEAVGITQQTFYRWLRDDAVFHSIVEKARRSHLQQVSFARQQWEQRRAFIAELEKVFAN